MFDKYLAQIPKHKLRLIKDIFSFSKSLISLIQFIHLQPEENLLFIYPVFARAELVMDRWKTDPVLAMY